MKIIKGGPIFENEEILEAEELNDEEVFKFHKRYSKLIIKDGKEK